MKIRNRKITGTISDEIRLYETLHRRVAREAAADGFVLLQNRNNILPLDKDQQIALYGPGADYTIKGGTGSGDVNVRDMISIREGLENAGFNIANKDWLDEYKSRYQHARLEWRTTIWNKLEGKEDNDALAFFDAYATTPFIAPVGGEPKRDADTAIYILSRTSGEGADRDYRKGDYLISDEEEAFLEKLCEIYPHIILILNTGGLVDLRFIDNKPRIEAILYIHQPGQEAGNAVADVLEGKVTPSGKLTDTWALKYEDYPSAMTFSHMDGNVDEEIYQEGIYVGYRYFDTFGISTRYSFGFGLSYTTFTVKSNKLKIQNSAAGKQIAMDVEVKNIGKRYAGKEVVQLYVSCPQSEEGKEYRRLVAYAKTKELCPGESAEIKLEFPLAALSSYDTERAAYILEKGAYGLFLGDSLDRANLTGIITLDKEVTILQTEHICTPKKPIHELRPDAIAMEKRRQEWIRNTAGGLLTLNLSGNDIAAETVIYDGGYENTSREVREFVNTLTVDQLILLATGDIGKGQGSAVVGSAGISIPGSAAQTSDCAKEQGLADIVLADGPAGLRLNRQYEMVNGYPKPQPMLMAMENGFLLKNMPEPEGEVWHQYCTAIPSGTLLAQTWNTEIVSRCGRLVAEEMEEFEVSLWLAPGMNIHRNPLCGRNFEYYSEDPLVAGYTAAAMTEGVQSVKGCGTTIKHFACNNQEDNRMGTDSVISERALREIYLKGFEICVRKAQPMAIMTSYNKINGIHAANNYDICTKAARDEWGFRGLIMTDWTTTMHGDGCTAAGCMRAGNDVVMPGCQNDHDNIRKELDDGTLQLKDLKRSTARLVNVIWHSNQYVE